MGDKLFLTYNQQMKKLRDDKRIDCKGSSHKRILVRSGYFNIINGYKMPFVASTDAKGRHTYIGGTNINQLYAVKVFDDKLRSLLLRYITQVEEEIRSLTSYKFDVCNNNGAIPWYHTDAYSPRRTLQEKMNVISKAYKELSDSRLDYVIFYKEHHEQIPTWIMIKVINFSTFIDVLDFSKSDVQHSICELYGMIDANGKPNVKLLIGSLHWMRKIRNSCAHNERVYCISRNTITRGSANKRGSTGRILEGYFKALPPAYSRGQQDQRIMDLIVYFKYYLPKSEFRIFIKEISSMLVDLQSKISPSAFDYVRGRMGIKRLADLDSLERLLKDDIDYNSFDRL